MKKNTLDTIAIVLITLGLICGSLSGSNIHWFSIWEGVMFVGLVIFLINNPCPPYEHDEIGF